MKFLRLAFYVLIAQLVLSGCAGEGVEETSSSSSSEITFDAYVGRNASTRAGVTDIDFLRQDKSIWNAGFGVFARYNHTDGTISSLMDTEWVTWNKNQNPNHWEYTNTRYWPNEGFVDFYAFAPYNGGVTMGKLPDYLVNNPDSKDETYIWFPSYMNPIDLLWAKAENQTKENNSGAKKVEFTFNHATARLGFDITANQELEENGAVIIVENVKLYGSSDAQGVFALEGYLNLKTGKWILGTYATRWYYTWTLHGNKDGEEKDPELKLSASQLDHTHNIITNAPNSYIFIIPQTKSEAFYLQITYTVKQGDFEEEVTVKKNLLEVLNPSGVSNSFEFVMGKAYVFHLKLSLDPVKFSVTPTVEDFDKVNDKTMFL